MYLSSSQSNWGWQFLPVLKISNQYYRFANTLKTFFWRFITIKICADFSFVSFWFLGIFHCMQIQHKTIFSYYCWIYSRYYHNFEIFERFFSKGNIFSSAIILLIFTLSIKIGLCVDEIYVFRLQCHQTLQILNQLYYDKFLQIFMCYNVPLCWSQTKIS